MGCTFNSATLILASSITLVCLPKTLKLSLIQYCQLKYRCYSYFTSFFLNLYFSVPGKSQNTTLHFLFMYPYSHFLSVIVSEFFLKGRFLFLYFFTTSSPVSFHQHTSQGTCHPLFTSFNLPQTCFRSGNHHIVICFFEGFFFLNFFICFLYFYILDSF